MYKIIAIMGEAGTGKDTLMQEVLKVHPFHEIVSCTTRPPREGEVDGVNYHFLTNEEFAAKVLNDEMLEATEFNNWFYGTGLESLSEDEINIGVFNPTGIESLLAHRDKVKVIVFRVYVSDKTRLIRQLNREREPDVHEIIRRFKADWIDFDDLSDIPHIAICNETKEDLQAGVRTILQSVEEL